MTRQQPEDQACSRFVLASHSGARAQLPGFFSGSIHPRQHAPCLAFIRAPIIELPKIDLPSWLPWDRSAKEQQTLQFQSSIAAELQEQVPIRSRLIVSSPADPLTAASSATISVATPAPRAQVPVRRFPRRRQQEEETQPPAPLDVPSTSSTIGSTAAAQREPLVSVSPHTAEAEAASFAVEQTTGRRRLYHAAAGVDAKGAAWEGFEVCDEPQTWKSRGQRVMNAYLLPQGYPDSVAPQYAKYMGWRGVQYFFGGAISVFTTQALLGALGVAGRYSGEAAAAINWVIKDGAGRAGRFLFARWGRELDCELKQFRLFGDLLMETGAAMELATSLAPRMFLPLACTANLAKNLAAVAASATRAPIYRTFARSNNLADITAKGESVANLADILGTCFGIALSRSGVPVLGCFLGLSAGYLVSSRQEVAAVELPYLNRARLAYSAKEFLRSGVVPGILEANQNEPLLPWGDHNQQRIVLGASVTQACGGPSDLRLPLALHRDEKYIITYRPETRKVYILLRAGSLPLDFLKAAFTAHVFLHVVDGQPMPAASFLDPPAPPSSDNDNGKDKARRSAKAKKAAARAGGCGTPAAAVPLVGSTTAALTLAGDVTRPWHQALLETRELLDRLYPEFLLQAEAGGWKLAQTMLNPRETRLLHTATPLLAE